MLAITSANNYCWNVMKEKETHALSDAWQGYSPEQKIAMSLVTTLTLARPAIASLVSLKALDKEREWTTEDSALLSMAYATDLEGNLARAAGVATEFGAKLDPIADKMASSPHEIALAYRGEEKSGRVAIRIGRDVGISALRYYAKKATDGQVSVKANWSGKANTFLRQATNVFASSPLGKKYPRTKNALQIATTASTVASGIYTGYALLRDVRKIKATKKASRE